MRTIAAEATEIAEDVRLAEARALACAARRRAFWGPAHLEQRLSDSTEMLTLAREAGDLELELQASRVARGRPARARRLGRRRRADRGVHGRRRTAASAAVPVERDRMAGDAGAARRQARAGRPAGRRGAGDRLARRDRYRASVLRHPAAGDPAASRAGWASSRLPRGSWWRPIPIARPGEQRWRRCSPKEGRDAEAQREVDALAAQDFEDIPQDGDWLIAMTLLAECCAELKDQTRAAQLYELLMPYRDDNVVIGLAAVCMGSAARYLGRLAAVMGRNEEAAEHFERALVANAALEAPVFLAHTQIDFAQALGPCSRATELTQAAARTAKSLTLPRVSRRLAQLQDS